MKRSVLAVLTAFLLCAAVAQAQRTGSGGGGAAHGGFGGGGHAQVAAKNGGVGITGGYAHGGRRRGGYGNGWGYGWPGYYGGYGLGWDLPYWDYVDFPPSDNSYGPEGPDPGYAQNQPSGSVMVVRDNAPRPPAQSPKLVEIPLANDAQAKPVPPALFVLTNGEKLESRRYVLSANSLQVDVGRRQRTIPISQLNVDATIAANQQRGIDISFPQDRNSLFLGF